MWRASETDRLLLMAGQTSHYAIEPRGEYVFGIVAGGPMRSRRALSAAHTAGATRCLGSHERA